MSTQIPIGPLSWQALLASNPNSPTSPNAQNADFEQGWQQAHQETMVPLLQQQQQLAVEHAKTVLQGLKAQQKQDELQRQMQLGVATINAAHMAQAGARQSLNQPPSATTPPSPNATSVPTSGQDQAPPAGQPIGGTAGPMSSPSPTLSPDLLVQAQPNVQAGTDIPVQVPPEKALLPPEQQVPALMSDGQLVRPAVLTRADLENAWQQQHGMSDALVNLLAKETGVDPDDIQSMKPEDKQAFVSIAEKMMAGNFALQKQQAQDPNMLGGQAEMLQPGTAAYQAAVDLASGKLPLKDLNGIFQARKVDPRVKPAIYYTATQLNPNFNQAQYETGLKFATNAGVVKQVASLYNVLNGVNDLIRVSDNAARTGVPLLNSVVNKAGYQIGGKSYANLATARTAFADELSGALGFGGATDMAKKMGFDMTDANLSPDVFRDNLQSIVVPFINRKKDTLQGQMGVYGANSREFGGEGAGGNAPAAAAAASTRPPQIDAIVQKAKKDPKSLTQADWDALAAYRQQ